nr:hypothetical protein CFP56_79244 [Quercus suber]
MIQSTLADLAAAGMTVFADAGVAVTLESLKAWILRPRPKKVAVERVEAAVERVEEAVVREAAVVEDVVVERVEAGA